MFQKSRYRYCQCAVLAIVFLLGGCEALPYKIHTNVTRFYDPQHIFEKGSFILVAEDAQESSRLEFKSYANLVATYLQDLGYKPFSGTEITQADIIVALSYDSEQKQETRYHQQYTHIPSNGFHINGKDVIWHGSDFTVQQNVPEIVSVTEYKVELIFAQGNTARLIEDKWRLPNHIFEARAHHKGRNAPLHSVMPYMIKAIFTGFPGNNGETLDVGIPVRKSP